MSRKDVIEEKAWAILKEACEKLSLIPVDAEYVKNGSDWNLLMYADKEGGIGVDECEALSRMADPMLDEQNFISDQYILIVSSPGLGRQIKRPRDFEFARGKEVEVHTYKAIDGLKEFTGILADFDAGTVTILTGGEEKVFERKAVSSMRLTFEI